MKQEQLASLRGELDGKDFRVNLDTIEGEVAPQPPPFPESGVIYSPSQEPL